MIIHPIAPVFDSESKILILGSFPSVKSREAMFFYGHPQNRFWKVIAALYNEKIPNSVVEKKALLLRNHIVVCLPSTSPANAAWSFEQLLEKWRLICSIAED